MVSKKILALGGATLALVVTSSGAALASPGPTVVVRVEGATRTLLAPTVVRTPGSGWITKGGTPSGKCPAKSAAGALDVATHHQWGGSYSSSFGQPEIISILGESHSFTSPYYWSVWVDNRYAQSGACLLKPRTGDTVLFAVEPDTSYWYPLSLTTSGAARVGHKVTVKVVWFNTSGKRRPLAHAHVTGAGVNVVTNSHGVASIVAHHPGTLVLHADHKGYVRAAPLRVRVAS